MNYNLSKNQKLNVSAGYQPYTQVTATNAYNQGINEVQIGNAVASQVRAGKTFTSASAGINVAGNMSTIMSNQTISLAKGQSRTLTSGLYEGTNQFVSKPSTRTYTISSPRSGDIDLGSTNEIRYIALNGVIPTPTSTSYITTNGTYDIATAATLNVNVTYNYTQNYVVRNLANNTAYLSNYGEEHSYRYVDLGGNVHYVPYAWGEDVLSNSYFTPNGALFKLPMPIPCNYLTPIQLTNSGDATSIMLIEGTKDHIRLTRTNATTLQAYLIHNNGSSSVAETFNITNSITSSHTLQCYLYKQHTNNMDMTSGNYGKCEGNIFLIFNKKQSNGYSGGWSAVKFTCVCSKSDNYSWKMSDIISLLPSSSSTSVSKMNLTNVFGTFPYDVGESVISHANGLDPDVGVYSTTTTSAGVKSDFKVLYPQKSTLSITSSVNVATANSSANIKPWNYFGCGGTSTTGSITHLFCPNGHFTTLTKLNYSTLPSYNPYEIYNIIGQINQFELLYIGVANNTAYLCTGFFGGNSSVSTPIVIHKRVLSITTTRGLVNSPIVYKTDFYKHTDWWLGRGNLIFAAYHPSIDLKDISSKTYTNVIVDMYAPKTENINTTNDLNVISIEPIKQITIPIYYRNYMVFYNNVTGSLPYGIMDRTTDHFCDVNGRFFLDPFNSSYAKVYEI